jgi:cysteine synthase A
VSQVLDVIGNTSLVRLQRVVPKGSAEVWVKLEWENPTGSLKDRMANAVIARAEADGRLRPGGTVVEYSGGSTGASLGPGGCVVTLMADSGLKYVHTDVYRRS